MRNKLISSLAGAVFSFAASGLAFAADMVKAPPSPPPAPVYNWTGWYAGVNLGASFGTTKTDFNAAPIFSNGLQITSGFGGRDEVYPGSFIGGGQVGYNWQYSPLIVVGVEADVQGSGEKESSNFGPRVVDLKLALSGCGLAFGFGTSCTATGSYTTQIDWFGTVRARIGYVFGDGAVLTYVTGGLAYGEVKINGTNTVSGEASTFACDCDFLFSQTQAFDHSHVNTGWVIGSGTEGKLLIPGWTYKIEGLYMDLGHLDTTSVASGSSCTFIVGGSNPCGTPGFQSGGQVHTHTHFTDTILRLGVNYQFH